MPERDDNVREMWTEAELDRALAVLNDNVTTGTHALARARAELLLAAGGSREATVNMTGTNTMGTNTAETSRAGSDKARGKPFRRKSRWFAAAATIGVLVAGALVAQTVSFGGNSPASSAAAAQELNSAADKIGASDEPLGPNQYRYVGTRAWWLTQMQGSADNATFLREELREVWVPADRDQEWLAHRGTTGNYKWISGNEAEARSKGLLPKAENTDQRARRGEFYGPIKGSWQTPTPEFLAALPTGPQALYERLRTDTADRGKDPDLEMLVYVADVLRTGLVPANVRANLYRALALVPSLEVTDQAANLDGQVGVALGMTLGGEKKEIIIDRSTGRFIGERTVTTEDIEGIPSGTVSSYTSVTTAIVDNAGAKPRD